MPGSWMREADWQRRAWKDHDNDASPCFSIYRCLADSSKPLFRSDKLSCREDEVRPNVGELLLVTALLVSDGGLCCAHTTQLCPLLSAATVLVLLPSAFHQSSLLLWLPHVRLVHQKSYMWAGFAWYISPIYTLCPKRKRPPFIFPITLSKSTDFNDFCCAKSWENLTSIACTFAHLTCIL